MAVKNAEGLIAKLKSYFYHYVFEVHYLKSFNRTGELVPEYHAMITKKKYQTNF